jgi:membrane-bound lytic murein transglycosylase B
VVVGVLACVLALGVLAVVAVVAVSIATRQSTPAPYDPDGALSPANVATGTPLDQPAALAPTLDVAAWSAATSTATGVPARALEAYAAAEIAQRKATPRCHLSWVTLAGIGRVESRHGSYGAELDADGVARPPIIGIPLDGTNGTRLTRDTDRGRLDGDTTYDRAVGPMQFVPASWARYGKGDPQRIDDAARAAARLLCAGQRDLATGAGWWDGVLSYNASGDYARLVYAAAQRYTAPPPQPSKSP